MCLNKKSAIIFKKSNLPSKISKAETKIILEKNNNASNKESSVLKLKTNLYLKISEQIKLLLKLSQSRPEKSAEKTVILKNIAQLQKDLEQIGYDISRIYNQAVTK